MKKLLSMMANIYMPQTQRCTVSGFGATSVVRCY